MLRDRMGAIIMLRTLVIFLMLVSTPLPAYAVNPDDAREWLKGKKIAYSADEFVASAERGDTEALNLFLDAGMDPNAKNKDGRSAMQVAIERARSEAVRILIENGANLRPLTSVIGDKDALLQNAKSLGYLSFSAEYLSDGGRFYEEKVTAPFVETLGPRAYKEMRAGQQGGFGGLGILISLDENKRLQVVSPIENTPATRAGLKAGDKIVEVDGESVEGLVLEDAVKKLRGLEGSEVDITVKRPRSDEKIKEETLAFTLTRDRIKIPSVRRRLMDGDIGYIRVMDFNRDTAADFREAVGKLEAEGMRRLALDLRNNPGGPLGVAAELADEFLEKDRLICSVESFHDAPSAEFKAKAGVSTGFEMPVVVLVNRSTGGASEVVAGALRHWKAAVLLGERTSGMGLVQNTAPLPDGSAIIFTTGKLLTPNGDPILDGGLTPDIIVKISRERASHLFMMPEGPPLTRGGSGGDEPNDGQLRRALEFLKNYDLSGTFEQNIDTPDEQTETAPPKGERREILWDKNYDLWEPEIDLQIDQIEKENFL